MKCCFFTLAVCFAVVVFLNPASGDQIYPIYNGEQQWCWWNLVIQCSPYSGLAKYFHFLKPFTILFASTVIRRRLQAFIPV